MVSSKPRHPRRQTHRRGRSPRAQAAAQRPSRSAIRGCSRATTNGAAPPDRAAWQRDMNRLRTVILLFGFTLLTVVARMVIDGPSLLDALTAALISALLLGSLHLRKQARQRRRGSDSDTDRTGAANAEQR